jgi:hypothetical protein
MIEWLHNAMHPYDLDGLFMLVRDAYLATGIKAMTGWAWREARQAARTYTRKT